jgi:leucyl-tRNA synthetase
MAEELWARLGHDESITYQPFPEIDQAMLVCDTIEIPVQVNGKVRLRLTVSANVTDDELRSLALAEPKILLALAGARPKNIVVVPKRLVNVVL